MNADHSALIVRADSFQDAALNSLGSYIPYVDALSEVLLDRGAFNVAIVHNEESDVVAERIENLLGECAADSVVLLYLSTQGLRHNSTGDLFLAAANTRPGLLASTALDVALIRRCITRTCARQIVVLLDCGFGEVVQVDAGPAMTGAIDLTEHFYFDSSATDRAIVVISGSTEVKYAFKEDTYSRGDRPLLGHLTRAFTEAITACSQDFSLEGCVTVGEINQALCQGDAPGSKGVTPVTLISGSGDRICLAARERSVARVSEPAVAEAEDLDAPSTGVIDDDASIGASTERAATEPSDPDIVGVKSTAPLQSAGGRGKSRAPLVAAFVGCAILAVALVVTNRQSLSSEGNTTQTVRVTTTQTVTQYNAVTQTVTFTPLTTTYPGSPALNSLVQMLPAVVRSGCTEDADPRFVAQAKCRYSGTTVYYSQFGSRTAATGFVSKVAPTADGPCAKPGTQGSELIVTYRSGLNSGVARCGWYRTSADKPSYFGIAWSIPDKSYTGWVSTQVVTDAGWADLLEYWKLVSALL